MSKAFTKNKEKRSRTIANETNTSFVKNVTSRVSGLLPATITKWFSSPSSSNTNGSTPTAEATDSSTEDEAPESPIVTQPPAKRMRFNSTNKYNHFSPTDVNCTTSNIEITEIPAGSFPNTRFHDPASRNNLTLTPIRNTNETITNESSREKNERDAARYKSTQHTVSSIGQSIATKRKSIFDKRSREEDNTVGNETKKQKQTSSTEKRPCFKPGLLGSPFYPGRTMYGGAASSYMSRPNIQQHTVALVNETKSSEDSTMSSSARRILDLIESYSSPLMEARRIPHYTKPKNEKLYASTTADSNRTLSYKTNELQVANIASLLRLKQRSRLMDSTKTARQIIASHSSSNCPSTYPHIISPASTVVKPSKPKLDNEKEQSNKMTTKVKARVTRTNRGTPDLLEVATPVKLPTATLQIDHDKLPNFTFDTVPAKLVVTSTPKASLPIPKLPEAKKNIEVSTSKPEAVTTGITFKFSNPVKISCDTPEGNTTPPKFTFDSPERRIERNCVSKSDVSSVIGNVTETEKSITKPKDWQCPECWVNNKANVLKCVCCGYKQAPKPGKCSVCKLADNQAQKDKCAICEKMTSPPLTKSAQPSKWKCNKCWVQNEENVDKCVCCTADKPTPESVAAEAALKKAISKFPKASPCGGCFTINSKNMGYDLKQVKPLQLPPPSTTAGSDDKTDKWFTDLAKTQKSDKWECSSCLVRNESDKSVCVCCNAEKEPKSKLPETKFNFGLNTNTSFKFGIDPKVQQATIAKAPEEKVTAVPKLKEQSETNNNVLAETPTFTFTLPTKKSETKIEAPKAKIEEPVKFSFGIPKSMSVNKPEPTKMPEEDKEKPQEVPVVNFAAPNQEKPKPVEIFASPLTQKFENEIPLVPASNLFTPPPKVDVGAATQENTITSVPTTTSVTEPQTQNVFALSPSNLKPSTNLFSTPTAVSSTSNPFSASAQSTPVVTNTPTIGIMLPITPVQKTETTSVAPVPAPTPMFTFGANGVNNSTPMSSVLSTAVPAEKPKFQFTFGNNNTTKTDAPPTLLATSISQPMFKSPFATASDNNTKNTNTFSLTPGSTLGSNSVMTSSNLGGSNGLSATNGLGVNTLSGNPLGGNTLSGNNMSGNLLGGNTMTGNAFASNAMAGGNGVSSTSTLGGTNGLASNTLTGGNSLQTSNTLANNSITSGASNIFGSTVQKENMWNSNNNTPSSNPFGSNTTTNSLQKPPAFTFGSSFNATSSAPTFGSNAQPTQNIFGMPNQNNNNQPSLFSNAVQNPTPAPLFGASPPSSNPAPQMGMFGTSNISAPPAFGAPNPSMPSFEAPAMSAPAPAFNFGAPAPTTGIFGFGQQQPQQQAQQPGGVYSFGSSPAGAPPVQFTLGTAPNTGRRVRRALRRTTPR